MKMTNNSYPVSNSFDIEKLPSFISEGMKQKIMDNIHNLPSFISEQARSLSDFEEEKKKAERLAKEALDEAINAKNVELHWYKSDKTAIESLQKACKLQGDALESLAKAIKLSYINQKKIKDVTTFLLGLGLANTALNRMVIRELEMRLANASKEKIDELAKQELENVVKQLKAQEDLRGRLDKQKDTLDSHDKRISDNNNKLEFFKKEQSDFIELCKEQNSQALVDIKKQQENDLSEMQKAQEELLDKIEKQVNEKITEIKQISDALSKSQIDFISQSKEQTTQTLELIKKQQEEDLSSMQKGQKESLDRLERHLNDSLAELKQTSDALAKSQEVFVSQSKEQTSLVLSELQKEAKQKTMEIQEQTDGFIVKISKQLNIYKVISIVALIASIISIIFKFIM